jgi:hypothetical protein
MKDFSFNQVLGLMKKTTPFLFFRFFSIFGITQAFMIASGLLTARPIARHPPARIAMARLAAPGRDPVSARAPNLKNRKALIRGTSL